MSIKNVVLDEVYNNNNNNNNNELQYNEFRDDIQICYIVVLVLYAEFTAGIYVLLSSHFVAGYRHIVSVHVILRIKLLVLYLIPYVKFN